MATSLLNHYSIQLNITSQENLICSSVMTKGGEIRIELSQYKNQSVITPFSMARSMIGFKTSKL